MVTTILMTAVVLLGLDNYEFHEELADLRKHNSLFEHRFEKLEKEYSHPKSGHSLRAREAALQTKLAKLRVDVHQLERERKVTSQEVKKLKTAGKREALFIHKEARHEKRLRTEQKAILRRVVRLRKQQSQAWAARVVQRDLSKIKGWRWFQAAARDDAPLSKAISGITSELAQAKRQGLSDSEIGSSSRALSQLKKDRKELTLHRVPKHFAHDMKVAKVVMNFLKATAHPHILHHGYIYATMDFANPSGDDDGGPPNNGHQQKFLSLPRGWQLAPGTQDSRTVSINYGWNTDCLTFSDGTSWQTSDGSDNSFCGKHTLFSNKKKQYRPAQGSDHSRRILIRFPVPK